MSVASAGYFRIRVAAGTWMYPASSTDPFPGILDMAPIVFPEPSGENGNAIPTGLYGFPEARLSFPGLTHTQMQQIYNLWSGVPDYQASVEIEVELRNQFNTWKVWSAYANRPAKNGRSRKRYGGLLVEGVYFDVKTMVDITA